MKECNLKDNVCIISLFFHVRYLLTLQSCHGSLLFSQIFSLICKLTSFTFSKLQILHSWVGRYDSTYCELVEKRLLVEIWQYRLYQGKISAAGGRNLSQPPQLLTGEPALQQSAWLQDRFTTFRRGRSFTACLPPVPRVMRGQQEA